jgi:hypothetical protein
VSHADVVHGLMFTLGKNLGKFRGEVGVRDVPEARAETTEIYVGGKLVYTVVAGLLYPDYED